MRSILGQIRNGEADFCVIRYKVTSLLVPDVVEWQWALVAVDEGGIKALRKKKALKRNEFRGAASIPLFIEDIERKEALHFIQYDGMSQVVNNTHGEVWEMPGQPFKQYHYSIRSIMIEEDLLRC